jgi:hypothetical protein
MIDLQDKMSLIFFNDSRQIFLVNRVSNDKESIAELTMISLITYMYSVLMEKWQC